MLALDSHSSWQLAETPMMRQAFTLVLTLALVLTVGMRHADGAARDDSLRAARRLISLECLGQSAYEPGAFTFVLHNRSSLPVRFQGYDLRSPHYTVQAKSRRGWQSTGLIWCATGSRLLRLEPHSSIEFTRKVNYDRPEPFRIGITVTVGDTATEDWTVYTATIRLPKAWLSN